MKLSQIRVLSSLVSWSSWMKTGKIVGGMMGLCAALPLGSNSW